MMPSTTTVTPPGGLALWLIPTPDQHAFLQDFVEKHCRPSSRAGLSPKSYPRLIPHVTLISVPTSVPDAHGQLITVDRLKSFLPDPSSELSSRDGRLPGKVRAVVASDHFFRSVLAELDASPELAAYQRKIEARVQAAGWRVTAPMFPHVSLAYIADEDRAERARLLRELRDEGHVVDVEGGGVELRVGGREPLRTFEGAEVWIVDCDGPVENWKTEWSIRLDGS